MSIHRRPNRFYPTVLIGAAFFKSFALIPFLHPRAGRRPGPKGLRSLSFPERITYV